MMKRYILAFSSLATLTLTVTALTALTAPAVAADVETDHYLVHVEGTLDAAETGRLLEALHGQLAEWFGAKPDGKEKLRVGVYATRSKWEAALRADGCGVPDAGGYYSPRTRKAYLYVQPSAAYTRQLTIHEATHQFHYLAVTSNKAPEGFWYVEGLAEYFGMHEWDGRTLKTRVVPLVTLEDYPKRALANLEKLEWNVAGIVDGSVACARPEAWALIHFLDHEHAKRFRALRQRLDRGAKPGPTWRKSLGRVNRAFVASFREWLEAHQQPLEIAWVAWQSLGESRVEGSSATNAIAVFKQSPLRLETTIDLASGRAGLVYAYESTEAFCLFQLTPAGTVRGMRREGRKWITLFKKELPAAAAGPAAGGTVLQIRREKDGLTLIANGKTVFSVDGVPAGRFGVNVDGGRARFELRTK